MSIVWIVREDGSDYYNDLAAFTELSDAKAWAEWYVENIKHPSEGSTFIGFCELNPKPGAVTDGELVIMLRDGVWVETTRA